MSTLSGAICLILFLSSSLLAADAEQNSVRFGPNWSEFVIEYEIIPTINLVQDRPKPERTIDRNRTAAAESIGQRLGRPLWLSLSGYLVILVFVVLLLIYDAWLEPFLDRIKP